MIIATTLINRIKQMPLMPIFNTTFMCCVYFSTSSENLSRIKAPININGNKNISCGDDSLLLAKTCELRLNVIINQYIFLKMFKLLFIVLIQAVFSYILANFRLEQN